MSVLNVHASLRDIEPMVQIEDIRAAFSRRLKEAMADNDIEIWGAGVRLAKIASVTPKAANKWLNAETMPGPEKLLAICSALGVRREWLEYGDGAKRLGSYAQPEATQVTETLEALYSLRGKVTPRSRKALDAIERAANDGRLTEDDVLLLERIAQRFESTSQQD